jgi:methionyl-tRNA formyltransferase
MRVVFLGLPLAALLLAADGHEVVLAGVRPGLSLGLRRLRRALGPQRVVMDPQKDWAGFTRRARSLAPDLLVSWFFTRRIPMELCGAARLGGVGVHPSLLPRHRGPDPYFAAIDAGDLVTGVTAHRLEQDYDTGAILAQRPVPIDPGWNAWNLARALDRPSLQLLREVAADAARGEPLVGRPQDEALATAAPVPGDDEQRLCWELPAEAIVRRIRALAPNPGASCWLGDAELLVTAAQVHEAPRALMPGEAAVVDGLAVVRAGDTGVALLRAEVQGQAEGAEGLAMLVARSRGK